MKDKNTHLIHEVCWKILRAYFYNAPISLNELVDVVHLCIEVMRYDLRSDITLYGTEEDPTQPINFHHNNLDSLLSPPKPTRAVTRKRKEKSDGDVFANPTPPSH